MPPHGKHRAPRDQRRRGPLAFRLLVIGLILTMAIPAAADHDRLRIAAIDGCNVQPIGEGGHEIRWTSALKDGNYPFTPTSQSGAIASGHGAVLEVTVHWSIEDANDDPSGPPTQFDDIALRGPGFTPEGVDGVFTGHNEAKPEPVEGGFDPADCEVDVNAESYGFHTFYFTFTELHNPGRRGVAKGNAELNVFVESNVGSATLGTNLHVATGPEKSDGGDD